jgi:hypothetical protein
LVAGDDVYPAGSEARAFCLKGIDNLMADVTDNLTSPAAMVARVQDVFRAERDDEDLVIGPDTSQKNLKAWDSLAHNLASADGSAGDELPGRHSLRILASIRQSWLIGIVFRASNDRLYLRPVTGLDSRS